ncbi:TonB-dependent receptor [Noviherbaspirillum cavernae]|uniref:TonB-dependent receptor n=1 Tax=Noviherbaspirillum cavernae TaxID=2320862 RepID=A0A418X6S7_9BURK|nr:TonB-dependent receptor [Noviherbaspirillum cavernae]
MLAIGAAAQERTLDPVVVSASRVEQRVFDTPAAVNRVDLDWRNSNVLGISVAEPLAGVPGMAVRDRQNFSQDVQLSIRGFGSRATFGVRGSRILVDGIPASMPDGQGQASTINLASAQHVEVLRGPWAQMYGNAGGGVLLVESRRAPDTPTASLRLAAGSLDFTQMMASGGMRINPALGLQAAAEGFSTDGVRAHSAARRRYLDLRADWQTDAATSVRVGINGFSQPQAQDPMGLTQAEFERDPGMTNPLAFQFDTGKTVDQYQLGVQAERRITARDRLSLTAYAGNRTLTQFLGFSGVAPTSSGGVVDLDRNYFGTGIGWQRQPDSGDRIPLRWSAGAEIEAMRDKRRGFVNNNGSEGALRRDEDNDATSYGAYGQLGAYVRPDVQLLAGARYSDVRFKVDDHFITAASPNDSGSVSYSQFSPVLGVLWSASESLNVFANAGRGFETPTFTEIAYRPGGTGVNFGLQPARSRHFETGAKMQRDALALEAALFYSMTDDDIVPLSNQGGRATFGNVDGVRRYGLELGARTGWRSIDWSLAYTLLYASFTQGFVNADGRQVNAGNQLPATARHTFQLEATWRPSQDTSVGAVLHAESRIYANDINSEAAPGYFTLGLNAGRTFRVGRTQTRLFVRVDNLFDRSYSGSVIVNEANRRYYEPAAGRTFVAGVVIGL